MQITIQTDAGAPTTLIDGPDRSLNKIMGPVGFSVGSVTDMQPRKSIRGTNAKPTDRGNVQNSFTMSGARKCASDAAALSWLLGFLTTCPRNNTIKFIEGATIKTLADAVLQISGSRKGSILFLTYTITGGALS